MKATRICSVDGCSKPIRCRELCDNCYRKAKRAGLITNLPDHRPSVCIVDGCSDHSRAHGMCPIHYGRWRHHGDTDPLPRQKPDDVWDRTAETADGCLEFIGARTKAGYGTMYVDGVTRLTHRLAWEVAYGPIPAGMQVCHHCDNPPCCNPNHFFIGTAADNAADKVSKGRHLPSFWGRA